MPNRLFAGLMWLLCLALPGFAQTNPAASPPGADASPTSQPPSSAGAPRKVWTNEELQKSNAGVSVVGDKRNQNYHMSPAQPADPATVAHVRKNLEKLTRQLEETNHKLAELKKFEAGDDVHDPGRQINRGLDRTPVNQQIAQLQASKKKLESQISELLDDARKRGIEPGQLR